MGHTYIHTQTAVPYAKTVTEHKAPTDDSIRLLNEFEEKARKNIIHKVVIDENYLKAAAIYYRDMSAISGDEILFDIRLELNGTEVLISDSISGFEWRDEYRKLWNGFGNEAIFKIVYKKFSEMIALELMKQSPDFLEEITSNPPRARF